MSLHGAPLSCLTFKDKAQDIKESWPREKTSARTTRNSDVQRDKEAAAIVPLRFDIIYHLIVINKGLTTDSRATAGRRFNGAERDRKSSDLSQ